MTEREYRLTRRGVNLGLAGGLGATALGLPGLLRAASDSTADPVFGPPRPFSADALIAQAQALAQSPYRAPPEPAPQVLDRIDYDAHWRIRFRPERSVAIGGATIQFFHLGRYFRHPIAVYRLDGGAAREIRYRRDDFDMPADSPAHALPADAGWAGFRLMRPGLHTDWLSFLGAAYFRADGPDHQYGLSARAVAVNTGLSRPEEFPRFTTFYIGADAAGVATIYALFDSPSLTGVMRLHGGDAPAGQAFGISVRIFTRAAVERIGIAPLTSMYWYSESNRLQGRDWRPEIHDSDGLALHTGAGEYIWRPLDNPPRVVTSSFADHAPRGFGLIQRDRNFDHYQDDGVFYNRRPSVWVAPKGDWGAGAVQLVEIPTEDETSDNIVAYWSPETAPQAHSALAYDYRLTWGRAEAAPWPLARCVATRIGRGGRPGQHHPPDMLKLALDFVGGPLAALNPGSRVMPQISAPAGVEIIDPYVLPIRGTDRWRLIFDLRAPAGLETLDLRAYLSRAGHALSETWLGQLHPQTQLARLNAPTQP